MAALLTAVTRDYERISMRGVRRVLLERQAASLGLPLHEVFIAKDATNQEYEAQMEAAFRLYREQFLARHGMRGLYPVWGRDTAELIRGFIGLGFKAVVTCVDGKVLDSSFAGMMIDEDFLSMLPCT